MYRSPAEAGHGVIACLLLLGSPSSSAIGRRKELEWPMLPAVSDAKPFAGMWGFPPALWLEAVGFTLIPTGLAFSSEAVLVKDAVPQQACCKAFLPWPILLLQMLEVAPPSPALLCVLPVTLDEFVVESRPDMTLPSPLVWAWLLWRRCRLDSMWLSPLLAPVPLACLCSSGSDSLLKFLSHSGPRSPTRYSLSQVS